MHHTARHVRAGGGPAVDRGGDGVDREPGLHPIRDGVAHDPVGVDVLDRAQIELALGGGVLGDVGQPQLVRLGGGEVPFDPVVVDRRAGPFAVLAAFHPERGPPVLVAADPPHRPVTTAVAGGTGPISQQPMPELGVVDVGVEHRVRQLGPAPLAGSDRAGGPAVVGLAGELQNPARHRDGDPVPASSRTSGYICHGWWLARGWLRG